MRGDPRAEVTAVSAVRRIAVGALRPLRRATSAAVTDKTDVTTLGDNYSKPRTVRLLLFLPSPALLFTWI